MANDINVKLNVQNKKAIANVKGFERTALGSFGAVSKSLGVLGAAFGGLFAARAILNNVKEFSTALGEVKTITDDSITSNKDFAKSFIDLSSQFGGTPAEQAKVYYQVVSAGITDATKANDVLIASNKLAIGGLASQSEAVNILTTAVNSFQKNSITASEAADILFGTVKLGKTTVSELASSMGAVLASADALGVTFKEVSAAVATLTTRGKTSSEAVTGLNAIFTAVLKKQGEAAKFGPRVSKAFNTQALASKGLTKFLIDLDSALGGSQEKLVKLLGRAEGAQAITILAGDGFKSLANNVEELGSSAGAANAAFEKINNTLSRQLDLMFQKLSNITLRFVLDGEGVAVAVLKQINSLLDSLERNFDDVKDAISSTVVFLRSFIIALIAMKFAPALLTVMAFRTKALAVDFFTANLSFKTLALGVITGSKAMIASLKLVRLSGVALKAVFTLGLTLVIDELIFKLIVFAEKFGGVINVIKNAAITVFKFMVNTLKQIIDLMLSIPVVGKQIERMFPQLTKKLERTLDSLEQARVEEIGHSLGEDLKEGVVSGFEGVGQEVNTAFEAMKNDLKDVGKTAIQVIEETKVNRLRILDQALQSGLIKETTHAKQVAAIKLQIEIDAAEKASIEKQKILDAELQRAQQAYSQPFKFALEAAGGSVYQPSAGESAVLGGLNQVLSGIKGFKGTKDIEKEFEQTRIQLEKQLKSNEISFTDYQEKLADAERKRLDGLQASQKDAYDKSVSILSGIANQLIPGIGPLMEILSQDPEKIKEFIKAFVDAVPFIIEAIIENIPVLIEALIDATPRIIQALVTGTVRGLERFINMIGKYIGQLINSIGAGAHKFVSTIVGGAFSFVGRILEGATGFIGRILQGAGRFIGELMNGIYKAFDKLMNSIGLGSRGAGGFLSRVFGLAKGGEIPSGYSNDTFPARLSSGENVIDRSTNEMLKEFLFNFKSSRGESQQQSGQSQKIDIRLQLGERELSQVLLDLNRKGFRLA